MMTETNTIPMHIQFVSNTFFVPVHVEIVPDNARVHRSASFNSDNYRSKLTKSNRRRTLSSSPPPRTNADRWESLSTASTKHNNKQDQSCVAPKIPIRLQENSAPKPPIRIPDGQTSSPITVLRNAV